MKACLVPARNLGHYQERSKYGSMYHGIVECYETYYGGILTRGVLSYYGEDLYSRTEHTQKGRVRMPLFRNTQQTIEPMYTPSGLLYAVSVIYNSGGNLEDVPTYTTA